jgi:hypothetical protein
VVGFCVRTDGGVSYVACPWCYTHISPSYCQYQASTYNDIMLEDTGSSSSDTEQLEDDFVYNCLRSLAGFPYAQLELTPDMWVACSNFKELAEARVGDRPFGRIGVFQRLAEELAWDVPAGLVVVNLETEKALFSKPDKNLLLLADTQLLHTCGFGRQEGFCCWTTARLGSSRIITNLVGCIQRFGVSFD